MIEIWKQIFETNYWISNMGRVKSTRKILKSQISKNKYSVVDLNINGVHKRLYIHRLVALHFIENKYNYEEVNHKDENKQNNNVENLEWCDRLYNVNYGTAKERQIKNQHYKPVIQLSINGEILNTFKGVREAERSGNFKRSHIINCCKGRYSQHGGYIWKYDIN